MIVAHRGASRDAPENTLKAFRLAWAQGADAVETDLRLTADGVLVCIHDERTGRVAERDLLVSASMLAELQALDVGDGERIPTLDQALATVPGDGVLFAEIKCGPAAIPRLLEESADAGFGPDRLTVISFREDVLIAVREQMPDYNTILLLDTGDLDGGNDPQGAVIGRMVRARANGVSLSDSFELRLCNGQGLSQQGVQWHVWTIDDPSIAMAYMEHGAASVTTNMPGLIRQNLGEQSLASRLRSIPSPGITALWVFCLGIVRLVRRIFRSNGRDGKGESDDA